MVWVHNLNPILLDLGPVQIRWYGLMWVLGFLFTYWYVRQRIKQGKAPLNLEELDSMMVWGTLGVLIGARLGEILIYRFPYYLASPLKVFAVWEGGLSFHGALVGILVAAWFWCRKYKKDLLQIADTFVIPLALANTFGRLGNFINGELPGRLTTLPWGMQFPGVEGFRHPSQLYEAAYNVVLFAILHFNRDKKWKPGSFFALWLMLYAVARFITEFFREPEIYVGLLTMGQFLNVFVFAAGLGLWLYVRRK